MDPTRVRWRKDTPRWHESTSHGHESTPHWRKSTHSGQENACVEVATTAQDVFVRDSKTPDGPVLRFSHEAWRDFIAGIRDGDLAGPG